MTSLLVILIGTVLTNTFLLMRDDGTLGGDRHTGSIAAAIRIAAATLITLSIAALVLLALLAVIPAAPADANLLVFSISVVGSAIALDRYARRRLPLLGRALASSPVLIVGNCLSLGAVLLIVLPQSRTFAILMDAPALGALFGIVLSAFVALVARITEPEVPPAFRIAPVTLVSAGLTALALMGLTGLLRS